MESAVCYWILTLCCLLQGRWGVHAACSEPLGVANAYITSTSPYNTNDRVYFRCYDGFSMSGTPSLLCLSSGSFSGTSPTCAANNEAVTIKQTVTSPQDDGNSGWMMLAFGSFIGLILLLLIIFALVFFYFMFRRQREQANMLYQRRTANHQQSFRDSNRYPANSNMPRGSVASPSQVTADDKSEVPTLDLSNNTWTPRTTNTGAPRFNY